MAPVAADVTACLVTRGDVDMQPILDTLPYGEVLIWDNSRREDLKTYGRFAAAAEASNPIVYFQDDDCLFRHHDELLAAYEPGLLVANWGHGDNPDGYDDIALYHGGALVDRDLIDVPFARYLEHFPRDEWFLYEADFIFGCLTPHKHVYLPIELRENCFNGRRMCDQPWQREKKFDITQRARAIRDRVLVAA